VSISTLTAYVATAQIIFSVTVQGQRLVLPAACPPELSGIITSCWRDDPAARPPFQQLHAQLCELLQLERGAVAAP
jgi:hypothetical protein